MMQEIAQGIYIDNSFIGVTLGAISLPHGLILIDAPPRPEDIRSWRATLLNLGGGVDRLLVNLDSHVDRTLGVRGMECTVVAHEKTASIFRNRPTTFKPQSVETGAEWEMVNGLGSIRWAPPEITFTDQLNIQWNDEPVILSYRPGPNPGALWVTLPQSRVIFLGDAVVAAQPPFLANADIPTWIETIQPLLTSAYRDYLVVSGRTGLLPIGDIRAQVAYLEEIYDRLESMAAHKDPPEATESLIQPLLNRLKIPPERHDMFFQRLRWGLFQYYARHYYPASLEVEE